MFMSNIVTEVLYIQNPVLAVDGGKGTLAEGKLPRVILDISDEPEMMKTLFYDTPHGKSGDNEFSAACAMLVKRKGAESTMRIKGWAFDDDHEFGFSQVERLSFFGAQPEVVNRAKASTGFVNGETDF